MTLSALHLKLCRISISTVPVGTHGQVREIPMQSELSSVWGFRFAILEIEVGASGLVFRLQDLLEVCKASNSWSFGLGLQCLEARPWALELDV